MHIYPIIPQWTETVEFEGKKFDVTMSIGGSWVPRKLGEHLIQIGKARRGDLYEFPPPRWTQQSGKEGSSHGAPVDMWAAWVKERKS